MKHMIAMAVGAMFLSPTYTFSAQYGSMMNGGNGGMWAGASNRKYFFLTLMGRPTC